MKIRNRFLKLFFHVIVYLVCISFISASASLNQSVAEDTVGEYIGPGPGDIYREIIWNKPKPFMRNLHLVFDPERKDSEALENLPNTMNYISVLDFEKAVKCEITLELIDITTGTKDKRIRFNENKWIPIPESENIAAEKPENYLTHRIVTVPIPIEDIKKGVNKFDLTCGDNDKGTGMFGFYGIILRIYYDSSKEHVKGNIVLPDTGSKIGDIAKLKIELENPKEKVKQVDYIGYYEDYDYDGDGLYLDWQFSLRNCEMINQIGSLHNSFPPFLYLWDTKWIPDQKQPIKIMARIKSEGNIYYMTQVIDNINLSRENTSVKLYRPYDIPENFIAASEGDGLNLVEMKDTPDDSALAELHMSTWNGSACDLISINGNAVSKDIGIADDQYYEKIPIPADLLKRGTNEILIRSSDEKGVRILWPGMAIKVREVK